MTTKAPREFTDKFKQEAVSLLEGSGRPPLPGPTRRGPIGRNSCPLKWRMIRPPLLHDGLIFTVGMCKHVRAMAAQFA